jgi:hypothetical protein
MLSLLIGAVSSTSISFLFRCLTAASKDVYAHSPDIFVAVPI